MAPRKGPSNDDGMSYATALKDLKSVGELVRTQIEAGMDEGDVVQHHFKGWVEKLKRIKGTMTDSHISELTKASNNGPWSTEQKLELAKVIAALDASTTQTDAIKARAQQSCLQFENYLSDETWVKLRRWRHYPRPARCHFVAETAVSVNIINPSQPTLYRMTAIVAFGENNYEFSQAEVYDTMDKIQIYIKSLTADDTMPYESQYPPTPSTLNPTITSKAYKDILPSVVDIPELDSILGDNKMRGRPPRTSSSNRWQHSDWHHHSGWSTYDWPRDRQDNYKQSWSLTEPASSWHRDGEEVGMPLDLLKGRSKQPFASSSARANVPGFGVLGSQARRASAMQETLHDERPREELPTCFEPSEHDSEPTDHVHPFVAEVATDGAKGGAPKDSKGVAEDASKKSGAIDEFERAFLEARGKGPVLTKEQKAAAALAKKEAKKLASQERKEKRDAEKSSCERSCQGRKRSS